MTFEQDLLLGIDVKWIWLTLLIFLFFHIEKPAKYYFKQGLKAIEDGTPEAAILHFKNALTKKSNYPEVRAALSQLYVELGNAHAAEYLVKQNIKQGFDLENNVLLLAKVYFYQSKINDLDKLIQHWQVSIDLSVAVKEKLALYTNLILVHRRALPSPKPVAKPDIFDWTRDI